MKTTDELGDIHKGSMRRPCGGVVGGKAASCGVLARNHVSFHGAGDPRDWESSILEMEKAQASGLWDSACSFLRVPFGPLLHTLSYINGIELARLETACPPLARTRMCETASKAMVMANMRRHSKKGLPADFGIVETSWKQLTGWIGSPPAWCVLHDLYCATDGENSWEWSEGWSASDIDVSRWFGVTAKMGRVVGLALFSNSLRGELPRSLGSLANLRELLLHHNQLVGEIPTSLGTLRCLETLDLSANRFSGELPASLAAATRLVYLNVSSNRLSGALPEALGNLTRLEALHVDHNSFTGAIPPSLGALSKLEVLNASNCWLTGELPASLACLVSLRVLFLGHNRLTGRLDVLAPLCYDHRRGPPHDRHLPSGQLRELYANDNNLDVRDVHPTLATNLSVLFVERNRPRVVVTPIASSSSLAAMPPHQHRCSPDHRVPADPANRRVVPADPLPGHDAAATTWSTMALQRELENIPPAAERYRPIRPFNGRDVAKYDDDDDDDAPYL
ncbi:hypothetical protein CTAYLR_006064 [Chrysophaeum taylorii]|uniref:Disease resistance R13L4/SHOC-2-like LRR domain-containing protein n=1 Tax=Chrysophaeum taylorii TaxID=2483200 RepID=A0AAD7XNF6_9STRA|nr:hypothetical protein CTAYLR_006064 [Chrysophaeum taylorii]